MKLVFEESNKWYAGPGLEDYDVVSGVPIEIDDKTAKFALSTGKAKECKPAMNPAQKDKSNAERSPSKIHKKKSDKK